MAEVLLKCKADIKANNKKKQALLHYAAKYNKKVTIQLFLKPKAENEARDKDKQMPLQLARATPTFFSSKRQ